MRRQASSGGVPLLQEAWTLGTTHVRQALARTLATLVESVYLRD